MPPKRKRIANVSKSHNNQTNKVQNKKIKVEKGDSCKEEENSISDSDKLDPSELKVEGSKNTKSIIIDTFQKKTLLKCNECTKRFRFKNRYQEHLLNEHSKLQTAVSCNYCPVRCPNKAVLKKHISKYHERDIFTCPHCQKKFVRHAHVLRHMAQSGCDGQEITIYPCEICDATFTRKDNLMVHLRLQHIITKDYACKHCTYSTGSFSKLILHSMSLHMEKPLKLECDHCGKQTSSRAAMAKHLEIHGDRKYACDVCGYSTFTIEVMRRHVLTHVIEKPYKCEQCDRSFIQRWQLERHIARHTNNKCDQCNQSFHSLVDLIVHSKKHKDQNDEGTKFICPVQNCTAVDKDFGSHKCLKKHIKKHLHERPYGCEVCSKRYRTEAEARRHLAAHALERPRRCMYCVLPRAYIRGDQLLKHVRKLHPTVFAEHLRHVRTVLGNQQSVERVKKSELDAVLNVLDAEAESILQGYGEGVLYGGMQDADPRDGDLALVLPAAKSESNPLMSEEELAEKLGLLLTRLIDQDLLECFGWPEESIDNVLEKVIEHSGAKPADREKWTRVQRLRENSKHLFLYVVEDKNIARMLSKCTIDQVIQNILAQVDDDDDTETITAD